MSGRPTCDTPTCKQEAVSSDYLPYIGVVFACAEHMSPEAQVTK